jgi:hypothetical protein
MTLSILMTISRTVLYVTMLSVAIFYCYAECRYAECRYAECRGTFYSHNIATKISLNYIIDCSFAAEKSENNKFLFYNPV